MFPLDRSNAAKHSTQGLEEIFYSFRKRSIHTLSLYLAISLTLCVCILEERATGARSSVFTLNLQPFSSRFSICFEAIMIHKVVLRAHWFSMAVKSEADLRWQSFLLMNVKKRVGEYTVGGRKGERKKRRASRRRCKQISVVWLKMMIFLIHIFQTLTIQ